MDRIRDWVHRYPIGWVAGAAVLGLAIGLIAADTDTSELESERDQLRAEAEDAEAERVELADELDETKGRLNDAISRARRAESEGPDEPERPASQPEVAEPEPERPDRRTRLLNRVERICPEDREGLENMVEFAREKVREDFDVNVSDVDVLAALDEALKAPAARDQVRGDSCSPILAPLIVLLGSG